jgi:hypothetical protein
MSLPAVPDGRSPLTALYTYVAAATGTLAERVALLQFASWGRALKFTAARSTVMNGVRGRIPFSGPDGALNEAPPALDFGLGKRAGAR